MADTSFSKPSHTNGPVIRIYDLGTGGPYGEAAPNLGWDPVNLQWVKLKVDPNGQLYIANPGAGGGGVQYQELAAVSTVGTGNLILIHTTAGTAYVPTALNLTNANPMTVAIVDGTGNQITSFGGGGGGTTTVVQGTAANLNATVVGTVTILPSGTQNVLQIGTATDVELLYAQGANGTWTAVGYGASNINLPVQVQNTVTVTGTVTNIQSGTATDSIVGNVTVVQPTAANLNATVVGTVTNVPSGTQTVTGTVNLTGTGTVQPLNTIDFTATSTISAAAGTQTYVFQDCATMWLGFGGTQTFTGTLQVLGLVNGSSTATLEIYSTPLLTSPAVTIPTSGTITNLNYFVSVAGFDKIIVAPTSWTSGTATLQVEASQAQYAAYDIPTGTQTISGTVSITGTATTSPTGTQTVVGTITNIQSGTATDSIVGNVTVVQSTASNLNATVVGTVTAIESGTWSVTGVGTFTTSPTGTQTVAPTGTFTTSPTGTQTVAGTITNVPSGTQTVTGTVNLGNATQTATLVGLTAENLENNAQALDVFDFRTQELLQNILLNTTSLAADQIDTLVHNLPRGSAGYSYLPDGASGYIRQHRGGELSVADAHGRYQEAVYRGNVFANSPAATSPSSLNSTVIGNIIYNPIASGKILVMLVVGVVIGGTPPAIGSIYNYRIEVGTGPALAAPTGATTIPIFNSLIGYQGKSVGIAYSTATFAQAPIAAMPLQTIFMTATNTAGTTAAAIAYGQQGIVFDLGGAFQLYPGSFITIGQGASAAIAATVGWIWEEIPI